jgi:hypothetical protein
VPDRRRGAGGGDSIPAQPGTLVPGGRRDPVDGELEVLESDEACVVVVDGEPDDWLVRFEKTDDFAAREWADNMARVYNRRRGRSSAEARFGAAPPR